MLSVGTVKSNTENEEHRKSGRHSQFKFSEYNWKRKHEKLSHKGPWNHETGVILKDSIWGCVAGLEQIFGKELEEDNEVDQVLGLLSQELEEINFPKNETLVSQ